MKQTTLDLNGPILSFTQQPQDTSVCDGGTGTFVVIVAATFPTQTPANPATSTGSFSYQWYGNETALSNGTFKGATLSGTTTDTLTISNVTSPTTNKVQFYVGVDYIPSAYQSSSPITAGTGRSTGNALNEILYSNGATLTVFPSLSVITQPTDQTVSNNIRATFTTLGSLTDTTQGSISYRWQLDGNDLSDDATVSGSGTSTLSISRPAPSNVNNIPTTFTIRAKLTHPTACNSPIFTNNVTFTVEPIVIREIINYERVDDGGGFVSAESINIYNTSINFVANTGGNAISVYVPEKDIKVRITLAAGGGQSSGSVSGGQGGVSIFDYTLKQNTEYVFKLGSASLPTGGDNGGGGGAFFYEKARLVAVSGGGGGAGESGRGGDGGGIGLAGQPGAGSGAGRGGIRISNGTLSNSTGVDRLGTTGGRVSGCTIGTYYQQQGFSPCQDVGQKKWTGASGIVASQTAVIQRGYKSGQGFRNNGGNGSTSTSTSIFTQRTQVSDYITHFYNSSTNTHTLTHGRDNNTNATGADVLISYEYPNSANGLPCNAVLGYKSYLVQFTEPFIDTNYTVSASVSTVIIFTGEELVNVVISAGGAISPPGNGSVLIGDKTVSSFRVWCCRPTPQGLVNTYVRNWNFFAEGNVIRSYDSTATNGGGGSGTIGGNAATSNGSGGGGGSGYSDGTATLISSSTGGNTSINAYATIQSVAL